MLPSYGLLKNVNCPFYAVGLCNRPFCHFGHLKKDDELLQIEAHDKKKKELKSSSTPAPVSNVQNVQIKKEPIEVEVIDLDDDDDVQNQVQVHDQKPDLSSINVNIKIKKEIEQNDGEKPLKSPEKDTTNTNTDSTKDKSNKRKHSSSSSASSSPRKKDHHHHKDKEGDRSPSKSHKSDEKSDKKSHHHHKHKEKDKKKEKNKNNSKDFDKLLSQIDKIHSKEASSSEEELMDLEDFEYSAPADVDEDADQVEMECYQLFKEYKSSKESQQKPQKSISNAKIDENSSANNKRLAHDGASENPTSSARLAGENFKKPKTHRDTVQTMLDRFDNQAKKVIKENPNSSSSSKLSSNKNTEELSSNNNNNNNKGKKPRMSSVGNVQALLKKPYQAQTDTKPSASKSGTSSSSMISDEDYYNQTIAKTNPKGEKRMAHVPIKVEKKEIKSLTILPDTKISSKIPFLVRQKMLQRLYEECAKIYPEADDAVARALIEETELAQRCQSRMTYQSSATNTIFKIRKTEVEANDPSAAAESSNKNGVNNKGKLSHDAILAGKTRNSWSIFEPKKSVGHGAGTLDPNRVYKSMARYILSTNDLIENGYPRPNPNGIRGHVIAKPRKPELSPIKSTDLKVCDRCAKEFRVDESGFPVKQEKCFYHYGRRFKKRVNGLFEGRLSCCDGDVTADGCSVANSHVVGGSNRNLCGFVSALLEPGDENCMGRNPWDIIGLDCEMIYTTQGPELARVTVVSFNSQILYDQYVKTTHPVLDYNTRFSGISEEDLVAETTTILHVQAVLLANIRPNTIIIGHSLESDLLALKLCHNFCIDTAVVFPHKMGPPYKRALKNLSSEILGKIIQVSEFGHDSAEDARSALELVLWKIKNTKEKAPDGPI